MGLSGSKPDFSNKIGTGMMPPGDMELEIDADMTMLDLRQVPAALLRVTELARAPVRPFAVSLLGLHASGVIDFHTLVVARGR
jgi:hypothetical protein